MNQEQCAKKIGGILLKVSVGSFLSILLIEFTKVYLIPMSGELLQILIDQGFEGVKIGAWEVIMALLAVFTLLASPLFYKWENFSGVKLLTLLTSLFLQGANIVIAVVKSEVSSLFILVTWATSVCVVWFLFELGKSVLEWLRSTQRDS